LQLERGNSWSRRLLWNRSKKKTDHGAWKRKGALAGVGKRGGGEVYTFLYYPIRRKGGFKRRKKNPGLSTRAARKGQDWGPSSLKTKAKREKKGTPSIVVLRKRE